MAKKTADPAQGKFAFATPTWPEQAHLLQVVTFDYFGMLPDWAKRYDMDPDLALTLGNGLAAFGGLIDGGCRGFTTTDPAWNERPYRNIVDLARPLQEMGRHPGKKIGVEKISLEQQMIAMSRRLQALERRAA